MLTICSTLMMVERCAHEMIGIETRFHLEAWRTKITVPMTKIFTCLLRLHQFDIARERTALAPSLTIDDLETWSAGFRVHRCASSAPALFLVEEQRSGRAMAFANRSSNGLSR